MNMPEPRKVKVEGELSILQIAEKQLLATREGIIMWVVEARWAERNLEGNKKVERLAEIEGVIKKMEVLQELYEDIIMEERTKIVDKK